MDRMYFESVIREQQEEFYALLSRNWFHRREEELVNLSSNLAQVVIGVRRSGKSTLCLNVIKNSDLKFAYVNFEDERFQRISSDELNAILEVLYQLYGDFNYLFIDEIQNVDGWQYFVNRLLRQGMHILMTGSNAKLLSSELSTHLTGRYMKIELFPFSFSEYCEVLGVPLLYGTTKEKGLLSSAFDKYIRSGGFPELMNETRKTQYIDSLVSGIIENDIEKRYKISYKETFERLAEHVLNIAPAKLNYAELCRLFELKSVHTADNYISYLEKAYLICMIPKFSYKSQARIHNTKVYATDIAFMDNRQDAFAGENLGWRMETIVLIELLRRNRPYGRDVAYFSDKSGECDFLVCKGRNVESAMQVSYDISNPRTLNREVRGILNAVEKTKCDNLTIITRYEEQEIKEHGRTIKVVPIYKWLCEDN